jgi:alanine racemase
MTHRRLITTLSSVAPAGPAGADPDGGGTPHGPGETTPASGIRPTRIEVDLDALIGNALALRALFATRLYAVVKADAYGHGAAPVALALDRAGAADGFCVSLVEEGVALRDAGVGGPILVLGPAQAGGYGEMLARDLTPVVSDRRDLAALAALGRRRGRPVDVHLKVDTGMGRLGVAVADAAALAVVPGVAVAGLMTHFANADVDDPADRGCMTYAQLARFAEAEAAVRAAGAPLVVRHAANSSGAMLFPGARLDLVRVGIALYGNGHWATDDALPSPRRQAMRLVTEIAQVRVAPAGSTVGYGAHWRAEHDTRVAVLPLGYADGLPRRVTGRGEVVIRGRRCPLVGAISMDIAIADISAVPEARPGDEAVLLGTGGTETISTASYAAWSDLTEYEVTCGMSKRVPRTYAGGARSG